MRSESQLEALRGLVWALFPASLHLHPRHTLCASSHRSEAGARLSVTRSLLWFWMQSCVCGRLLVASTLEWAPQSWLPLSSADQNQHEQFEFASVHLSAKHCHFWSKETRPFPECSKILTRKHSNTTHSCLVNSSHCCVRDPGTLLCWVCACCCPCPMLTPASPSQGQLHPHVAAAHSLPGPTVCLALCTLEALALHSSGDSQLAPFMDLQKPSLGTQAGGVALQALDVALLGVT